MKKIILAFSTLFVITLSCTNNSGDIMETHDNLKKETSTNNVTSRTAQELDDFRNNENLIAVIDNIQAYKTAMSQDDYTGIKNSLDAIIVNSHALVNTYSQEEVESYLNELAVNNGESKFFGTHDNNKCTRNLNGTTYWDQCGFWEEVLVVITSAIVCQSPSSSSSQDMNDYYNCVQDRICKTC
ncbi:hypothetical protein MUU74_08950 [Chryseobacterium daecheongense]|uniref:hypothetical protein n=1 Tax=Chryseobacterium daecheongense TaxID=192389 RepID=UPI001FD6E3D7|nr:hypothetical protein [Chryseobacterium daecheongense]UOV00069.1 hypothetical protein MUU74_08950 [Chryseobacterium daecheongense]